MQPIPGVPFWQHARGVLWILEKLLEVDHPVEGATRTYPCVDRLAYGSPLRGIGPGHERFVFPRQQRRADDLDSARMGSEDQLLVPADHVGRRHLRCLWLVWIAAQIVDAEDHDDVGDAGLGQHVAIETLKPGLTDAVPEDSAAPRSLVQHAHRATRGVQLRS